MKLFTKDIDRQLFKQFHLGNDLDTQVVVTKIFNPYGRGRWFLLNSDPDDPDYIWAIVQMGENLEIGSVSRRELESIRVSPFRFPLERDLGFRPVNAGELLRGLREGKFYKKGGWVENENKEMLENQANEVKHHSEELGNALKNTDHVEAWVVGKMERATTDLSDVTHYLDGESKKMADGGKIDKLVGKHIDIYTEGVKEPMTEKITSSRVTPSHYTHRDLILEIKGGGEERIPISKLNDFLNHKQIYLKDSKGEDYAIALNKKYADGGVMAKGGEFADVGMANDMTRGEIENKQKGLQLRIAKIKKQISGYERGKYNKLFEEKVVPLQKELLELNELWGKAKYADGGVMAKGGMVVTSINDIPNLHKKIENGEVTYRGLGMGKLSSDFFKLTNDNGVRIKVDKKEYFITESDFDKISRDNNGKLKIKFDAPHRKYEDGGEVNKYAEVFDKLKKGDKIKITFSSGIKRSNEKDLLVVSKTIVGKGKSYESEKITFKNLDNPEGVKYYAYKRKSGYIGFAMGDMAISDVKISFDDKMKKGGMTKKNTTFDDKVKAIQSSLLKRNKVSPKVQKDYGKTYNKKEALQSAKRIAGAMRKKEK